MGRPGRTLLILAGVAVGGVVALLLLADRYGDLQQRAAAREAARRGTSPAAARAVVPPRPVERPQRTPAEWLDAFLAVRSEMRAALAEAPGATPAERLARLESSRRGALARAGLAEDEYRQIREVWRRVRRGESAPTPGFADAFSERPERLAGADLGDMESFDP